MKIEQITSAAAGGNEDMLAVFSHDGVTDIVVIDGASSVADQDYIDDIDGDVVWFVRTFAQALEQAVRRGDTQQTCTSLALKAVKASFARKAHGLAVPLHAWPIAAMTWIRVQKEEADGSRTLRIYCLGDCKALLLLPDRSVRDLDPYVNPQESVVQAAVASLASEGVTDAALRRERLMPMLRARRESQNTSDTPSVLCIDPQGPLRARVHTVQVAPASMLLAMTDGFYRMVDTYRTHTDEALADLCARAGLAAALQELRDYEAASMASASMSVKSSDDASAVSCLFL